MPVDQLLSLSVSHLVEQGQLIANHHHNNDQPITYEVRIFITTVQETNYCKQDILLVHFCECKSL